MNVRTPNRRVLRRLLLGVAAVAMLATGAVTYSASAATIAFPDPRVGFGAQTKLASGDVFVEVVVSNNGGVDAPAEGYVLRVDAGVSGSAVVRNVGGRPSFDCGLLGGIETCAIPLALPANTSHVLEVVLINETQPRVVSFDVSLATLPFDDIDTTVINFG